MMLFAKKKMRYVTLNDSELRLAKAALIQFRNKLIAKGLPTEDVNILLQKLYKKTNHTKSTCYTQRVLFCTPKERKLIL